LKRLFRDCPICKNSIGRILHTQHFSLPSNSGLPPFYDVVSCSECGFCFADTETSQEGYDLYYNQMSKYEDKETGSGGAMNSTDKIRLSTAAKIISDNCPNKNVSVLDIGCANGGLLMCLKEIGFKNLTGIDLSKICVDNVAHLGFSAFFGGIFNFNNIKARKYDVVILSHVLEHLRNLAQAIVNIKDILAENGFIYVEVPDASRYKDYFIVPYYYFDCEHINHFDLDALTNIFEYYDINCIYFNEREIKVSKTATYPVVSAIFKHSKIKSKLHIKPSIRVNDSIHEFVRASRMRSNYDMLNNIIESKIEVIVWGAGMYTMRLLQDSRLKECKILFFIDKDFKKQGNRINDIYIEQPEKILNQHKETPVIVASALYGKEIEKEIREIDHHYTRTVHIL
jgi:SAM-dependent methyltransferase